MDVDKKPMNVIPSDPRRKRRNSEGSGRGGETQQSVKSPRYDESPSKFKRSNVLSCKLNLGREREKKKFCLLINTLNCL